MALDLNAVMDGLGTALATITGLQVKDYGADQINTPSAIVALPDVNFDAAMGRGSDEALFPVHILVARVSDRSARDAMGNFIAGDLASIKEALEDDPTLGGACDTLRVQSAAPAPMTVAGVDYLGYTFTVQVVT